MAPAPPPLRLTRIRTDLLALLTRLGKGVGGYELLHLYEQEIGRHSSANTIYRTLRYLVKAGLVVHLPSTKTFVARLTPESDAFAFLVCVDCGAVNETKDGTIKNAVSSAASAIGFQPTRAVEVEGICHHCRQKSGSRAARPPRGGRSKPAADSGNLKRLSQ